MSDLLQLLPIYAFMLIPVWIPLIAMSVGGLRDVIAAPLSRSAGPRDSAARTAG